MVSRKPRSFYVAGPGLEPKCSKFKFRALPAGAEVFKLGAQQGLPEGKGILASLTLPQVEAAPGSSVTATSAPLTISLVRKKGGKGWEVTALALISPVGVRPQDKLSTGTHARKGGREGGTSSTGTSQAHALHLRPSPRGKGRAESCQLGEVFPGLTSWLLPGQLCGSCPHKCKALIRPRVTKCPSSISSCSTVPGKRRF